MTKTITEIIHSLKKTNLQYQVLEDWLDGILEEVEVQLGKKGGRDPEDKLGEIIEDIKKEVYK